MGCRFGWIGAVSADNWTSTAGMENKLNYEQLPSFMLAALFSSNEM